MIFANCGLKVDLNWVISLDFLVSYTNKQYLLYLLGMLVKPFIAVLMLYSG